MRRSLDANSPGRTLWGSVSRWAIRAARRYLGDRLIRVAKPHRMLDPAAGPLIAVKLSVLTRKTLGGLETDLSSRVLQPDGEPLPGVYAAAPTWGEQVWGGRPVDCVVGSWRGVSGPAGLRPDQLAFWQGLLSRATKTAEWTSDLDRHFWTEMYLDGAALRDYLQRERTEMRAMLSGLGLLSGAP